MSDPNTPPDVPPGLEPPYPLTPMPEPPTDYPPPPAPGRRRGDQAEVITETLEPSPVTIPPFSP